MDELELLKWEEEYKANLTCTERLGNDLSETPMQYVFPKIFKCCLKIGCCKRHRHFEKKANEVKV